MCRWKWQYTIEYTAKHTVRAENYLKHGVREKKQQQGDRCIWHFTEWQCFRADENKNYKMYMATTKKQRAERKKNGFANCRFCSIQFFRFFSLCSVRQGTWKQASLINIVILANVCVCAQDGLSAKVAANQNVFFNCRVPTFAVYGRCRCRISISIQRCRCANFFFVVEMCATMIWKGQKRLSNISHWKFVQQSTWSAYILA